MAGLQTIKIIRHVLPAKVRAMEPQHANSNINAVQERGRNWPGFRRRVEEKVLRQRKIHDYDILCKSWLIQNSKHLWYQAPPYLLPLLAQWVKWLRKCMVQSSHFFSRKKSVFVLQDSNWGGGGGGRSRGHPLIANYFHCLRTTLFNHFKIIWFSWSFLCIFLTESTVISFQRLLLTTIEL